MNRVIVYILILGIFLGSTPTAAAEIHLDNEIAAIPAKITNIYKCGHWESETSEGFYRIIYIEFYYGNSLLYVQWVQDFTPDDLTRHILYTLSIDEFNADDHIELTFDKPACIENNNELQFNIKAQSGHDEKQHLFDLRIMEEFGQYTINQKTL